VDALKALRDDSSLFGAVAKMFQYCRQRGAMHARRQVAACIEIGKRTHAAQAGEQSRPTSIALRFGETGERGQVEDELHVAGALELLEDDFVHAAVCLDERGGDDRERAGFLGVARGGEDFVRD